MSDQLETPAVSVRALLRRRADVSALDLELLAGGEGLDRRITSPAVQKTGLALAGFDEFLRAGRLLVFGESEIRFLQGLPVPARVDALRRVARRDLPALLVTDGLDVPPELALESERARLPLLRSGLSTPVAIARVTGVLEHHLAPRQIVHGVLMDILGLGVMMAGESGIGKSECALDLVVRGHRLVADDTIEVRRRAQTILLGSCPELTRHHMEIRGLGLIDVNELFGVASTRASKRIELVVRLERWEAGRDYDRLGIDDLTEEILGVRVPMIRMPVAPGRNLAILVEVAARTMLLRSRGHHAARRLTQRLADRLAQEDPGPADEEPGDEP